MHGQVYYQCDWTAYPMKQAYCYMPSWQGEKLVKRGSYCNWPSVAAHAQFLRYGGDTFTEEEYRRVMAHITEQAGYVVNIDKLHYSGLEHFGPATRTGACYSMAEYMAKCAENEAPVVFVKLSADGTLTESTVYPIEGKYDIAQCVRPMSETGTVSSFSSLRKIKGATKDTSLFVYHWLNATEPNHTASNHFKLQLFGDVAIVQIQKANGMPPRDRYINFDVAQYNELFVKKRRRSTAAEVQALTPEEYQSVKAAMQSSLTGFEEQASSGAEAPAGQGAVMPPQNGKELAAIAQLMENVPPLKRTCMDARLSSPPQVVRQVSVAA